MFSYIQHRIPEIADHIYQIDDAVKTGFGWSDGPFEIWDYVGISKGVELMKSAGLDVADWIEDMIIMEMIHFTKMKEDLLLIMINQLKNTYRNQVKKVIYTSRIYLRKKVFGQMKNAVLMT